MAQTLNGLKVLLVVAPTGFRDEELTEPRRILETAGATVVVATVGEAPEAVSMAGNRVPAISITEARSTDFAAAAVVGGSGSPAALWDNGILHKLLRMLLHDGKPVGAICLSGAVLARAGLLEGRSATVFVTSESLKALKEGGARYEKKPVVIDRNIITADGPASSEQFGRLFCNLVEGWRETSRAQRPGPRPAR